MKRQILIVLTVLLFLMAGCKSSKDIQLTPKDKGSDKEMYERAKKYIRKDPEKARLMYKEVMQLYPTSIYAKKSKIGIADSYFKAKDTASLIMAATEYQEYVNLYPNSPDAVYAIHKIGMCYYKQMKKPGRDQTNTFATIRAFQNLLKQYPDTVEAEDGKKKIAKARQYLATHYYHIGYYNFKFRAYQGAINRFKQVINEYPDFKNNDRLFFYTGKCYFKMNEFDTAISFFQKIVNSYPKSKYLKKSLKMIKKINKLIPAKGDKQ
ncbi:MAG: outer membrane protein assembly factor BamD [Candidatus Aminicenantes bacterium]|nr:outer membrane protein assembly factor BamD [Candidatus Aminicenantes bacterium]